MHMVDVCEVSTCVQCECEVRELSGCVSVR